MKSCPKCNSPHNKKGVYCSRVCANSRSWSEQDKELKRKSAKDYFQSLTEEQQQLVKLQMKENAIKCLQNRSRSGRYSGDVNYLLTTHFDLLAIQSKRVRVIAEQGFKCLHCNISEWLNQPIVLELDHINGNNNDNRRENLRALCPNCHSLTPTWRGRNTNKINTNRIDKIKRYVENITSAAPKC